MRFLRIFVMQLVVFLSLCGVVSGMEYPKEISSELPACAGAKVLQTMNVQGNMMVTMECAGAMEDVYADYKKKVEGGGWSIVMETKQPEANILMGQKEQKHLVLNVGASGGKVLVNITLGTRN